MFKEKTIRNILLSTIFVLFISGCASLETYEYSVTKLPEPNKTGVYHKVKKGETLWRIATTYGVPINDIINTNNIPNVAQVEENQLVFIPGVSEVKEIYLDKDKKKDEFIWPVKGKVIGYFLQDEGSFINKGIDIKTDPGEAVRASRTGKVVFADILPGYAKTVILDHLDGFYSVYSKNAEILVNLGDLVLKNKEIAKVGKERSISYLHFEIRKKSIEDNPLYYLP